MGTRGGKHNKQSITVTRLYMVKWTKISEVCFWFCSMFLFSCLLFWSLVMVPVCVMLPLPSCPLCYWFPSSMCHVLIGCHVHCVMSPLVCSSHVTLLVCNKYPCHCLVPGRVLIVYFLLSSRVESKVESKVESSRVESSQVKSVFGIALWFSLRSHPVDHRYSPLFSWVSLFFWF